MAALWCALVVVLAMVTPIPALAPVLVPARAAAVTLMRSK
jgi:hypothetical protein